MNSLTSSVLCTYVDEFNQTNHVHWKYVSFDNSIDIAIKYEIKLEKPPSEYPTARSLIFRGYYEYFDPGYGPRPSPATIKNNPEYALIDINDKRLLAGNILSKVDFQRTLSKFLIHKEDSSTESSDGSSGGLKTRVEALESRFDLLNKLVDATLRNIDLLQQQIDQLKPK